MTIIPSLETSACCACKTSEWLALPVAPNAAARCRLSGDEKLPQAVPLYGALTWLDDLLTSGKAISGLDIKGPGDPLASLTMTLEICKVLREKYPELPLGLTTLGLGLADHVDQLVERGISQITLRMDAVNQETVEKLYAWIRPGKRNMPLAKAAPLLIEEQVKAISACRTANLPVTVLTTVYSNGNDQEVEEIARCAGGFGVGSMTLKAGRCLSESGETLLMPSSEEMELLRTKAALHIKNVTLSKGGNSGALADLAADNSMGLPKATAERPNVAVLSSNGMDIDLHLGQAIKVLIYGPREDGLPCLLEARDLPEPGGAEKRWQQVADTLNDCFVLLAESGGQKPRDILGRSGLPLVLIDDNVEGTVDVLYGGGKKKGRSGASARVPTC